MPGLLNPHLRAFMLLGVSYLNRDSPGDIDTSLQIFQEQYCPAMKQLGDLLGQALCADNLGVIWLRQGKYTDAKQSFSSAYALYKQVGSRDGQAASLNSTAAALTRLGRSKEALEASKKAYQFYLGTGEVYGQAKSLQLMATAYWGEHNLPEALQSLQLALPLAEQAGNSALKSLILQEMENIKREQGAGSNKSSLGPPRRP